MKLEKIFACATAMAAPSASPVIIIIIMMTMVKMMIMVMMIGIIEMANNDEFYQVTWKVVQ